MSLRAEIVRLGFRWLLKPQRRAGLTIAQHRERIAKFQRWAPLPPRDCETVRSELGGIPVLRVAMPASRADCHILFLHGGGYVAGAPELYRHLLWRLAAAAAARVVAVAYRLAPEHPFPAALDDAAAAWRGLLAEAGNRHRIVVMGDSAGGGLALALALRLRDAAARLPAALVVMSPWTDLALTGTSLHRNAAADPVLNPAEMPGLAACYLADADPCTPYASPLYGDPRGLPPTLIQVGGDEVLLDDSTRLAARMRAAGCAVTLETWPRMPHVWQAFAPVMPEARRAILRIGAFVREHTGDAG
jgi:epsilon-lactone hydrolase